MFTRYLASVVAVCVAVVSTAACFDSPFEKDTRLIAGGVLVLACHVLMTAARR